ncbi:MAG: uridine diphosphate-N-acetylglucosamine-binding protein YvcK [bacterium]|nr:uridine diphosphate-N-acetylglucosamine-binding protein YvcK [bacterium]
MKKIVTIGGGSGQSLLLQYLKQYDFEISAIVSMIDDGGSTGRLRDQLDILPPGDIRRCLIALADDQTELQEMMSYRFSEGELAGHNAGNLMLAAMEKSMTDYEQSIKVFEKLLKCRGRVIPVTTELTTLQAILEDESVISGETNIDIPKHDAELAIKNVTLEPAVTATSSAITALQEADVIILTIGDLFTSIIPNLLVGGIAEAIADSKAQLIYTCNRQTKIGETNKFTALEYVNRLETYLAGRKIDTIIVDSTAVEAEIEPNLITYNVSALQSHGTQVIEAELATSDGLRIDGEKLAIELNKICNN